MRLRNAQRGFSLIEVLIAAALIAALGLALFTLLQEGIRTKRTVDNLSSRYHLARQAMERMANELSMAYLSAHKNAAELMVETNFEGKKDRVAFDAFGNAPFARGAKESDLRELSYFIDRDKKTDKPALMRRVHNNLTLKVGESGDTDVLCPNVKSLEFKYWDDDQKDWTDSWSTTSVDQKKILPSRIQITLVSMISEEKEQKFMTQVELWVKKPIAISK